MEDLDYIKSQCKLYTKKKLVHASKLLNEISKHLKHEKRIALENIIPRYSEYLKMQLETVAATDFRKTIPSRVESLNRYYDFIHNNGYDNVFSAQGKFRSTILEEFMFLLFRQYVDCLKKADGMNVIGCGSVKAYTNLYFKARDFDCFVNAPEIGVNTKDQDYAIYRNFKIAINDQEPVSISVPALAVEAKTYIDKTMLDSIIATAEKLKSGNPHTMFVAVAETYDVSSAVDPAYSRVDQIYVLRKNNRKGAWTAIDIDVVLSLFDDVRAHFGRPWSDVEARIKESGLVL